MTLFDYISFTSLCFSSLQNRLSTSTTVHNSLFCAFFCFSLLSLLTFSSPQCHATSGNAPTFGSASTYTTGDTHVLLLPCFHHHRHRLKARRNKMSRTTSAPPSPQRPSPSCRLVKLISLCVYVKPLFILHTLQKKVNYQGKITTTNTKKSSVITIIDGLPMDEGDQ